MVRIGHADVRLRDLKYIGGQKAVRSLRLILQSALDLLAFGRLERLTGEGRSADRKERRRIARVRREAALARREPGRKLELPYQIDERRVPPAGLKMRCPKCGYSISPEERSHVDSERLECPKCGERFIPNSGTR